jgi:ADP-ribose pyrophosphatase YjhB (NUDIX family)
MDCRERMKNFLCSFGRKEIITPKLTVDCIIDYNGSVVLIERRNPPYGWALPGGFVDVGETVEAAVRREMLEETNLALHDLKQFHVYSDPGRDKRMHTVAVVFTARAVDPPRAGDDAKNAKLCTRDEITRMIERREFAFDHGEILKDYVNQKT